MLNIGLSNWSFPSYDHTVFSKGFVQNLEHGNINKTKSDRRRNSSQIITQVVNKPTVQSNYLHKCTSKTENNHAGEFCA